MKRVAILGGGIGGMSAAHELAQRGFAVEVFEMRAVAGGKARTIDVPGTGTGGRDNLPGEHGFRFFPGFYTHLPDTMKRIPSGARTVFDHLVPASEFLMVCDPRRNLPFQARFPQSLTEWGRLFASLGSAVELEIPVRELAFFAGRMMRFLGACDDRRLAEYEKLPWWDFVDADHMSQAYRLQLAIGGTRALVAAQAKLASTRTIATVLTQLLLDFLAPTRPLDRLLDGPTSEVWLAPWLAHLRTMDVRYHFDSHASAITMKGGRIASATITHAGKSREVSADYYVAALPVEKFLPLVTAAMKRADPALGHLAELQVAWMNGMQFFLRQDAAVTNGHINCVATPNALTAISQAQFFSRPFTSYGDGTAHGCLSVDISDWEAHGLLSQTPLKDLSSRHAIKDEVLAQLRAALSPTAAHVVDDDNIACWFLDSDIRLPNPSGAANLEPLLINTAGSWQYRPEATTAIDNLFLAADYVRTNTDLATMEGANEAARRAVNGILDASGVAAARCELWSMREPVLFAPARAVDAWRFRRGLPQIGGLGSVAVAARPSKTVTAARAAKSASHVGDTHRARE